MADSICQSCGMPMPEDLQGYEKDGERSTDYCKYCYAGGNFAEPSATIEDMAKRLALIMSKMGKSEDEIYAAAENLQNLKRWK